MNGNFPDGLTTSTIIGVRIALTVGGFLFLHFNGHRMRAKKNSHERYVYASCCRVLQYPALLWPVTNTLVDVTTKWWLLVIIDAILLWLIFTLVKRFRDDDDDNFWSQLNKKIKNKTRLFFERLTTPQTIVN